MPNTTTVCLSASIPAELLPLVKQRARELGMTVSGYILVLFQRDMLDKQLNPPETMPRLTTRRVPPRIRRKQGGALS